VSSRPEFREWACRVLNNVEHIPQFMITIQTIVSVMHDERIAPRKELQNLFPPLVMWRISMIDKS
jgi:hypothetical protein